MSGSDEAPSQEPPVQPSIEKDLMSRGRPLLLLGIFILELGIFFGAMSMPIDQATQRTLQQAANSLQNATTDQPAAAMLGIIFSNNVKVALAEMIPAAGAVVFFVSIFNTGQVIQVLAMSRGVPGVFYGVALFIFPFSIVELFAYALAVCSGSMVLVAWRRKMLHREARVFVLEIAAVVLILLTAAVMETVTLLFPAVGLALWVPTGLFIAWLAVNFRRIFS